MTINEFLQTYRKLILGTTYNYTRPRVLCADGFTVSVQAGKGIYSDPRCDADEYSMVELGYPSAADEDLDYHKEDWKADSTKSVYPYVPVSLVDRVLEKHGGIVGTDFSNVRGGVWNEGKA